MTENIKVFKHNHIRVFINGKIVHIDPFMTDSAPKDADYILITHDHYDHFSVKDVERTANKTTIMIVPENMKKKAFEAEKHVGRIVTVKPDERYNVNGLEFETVPAYNIGKPFHPKDAGWVGYILHADGKRIYIAGDTDATEEARSVKCDIALVPVGGTYTMNAKEAAELVNTIRPEAAVPVHYGAIVGKKKDGEAFAGMVDGGIKAVIKIE
ncbi:MAG: MBL fold metallo-hydrolase [Eubacteriales bacterium]|nr:MBL fold metallo-hydrolase [Eubacteriales bacterium]